MRIFKLITIMFSFLFSAKTLDAQIKSIYDVKITSLDGGTIHLSKYKGKKIMIVNTASECGYTPQYKGLEELYEKYKDQMVIIGFPCNNFMSQEPGDAKQIRQFCTANYGVTFPMTAKIDVKGKNQHPLYTWLTQKRYNHFSDNSVKWNFQKYLIDERGNLVQVFQPKTEPLSAEIIAAIEKTN